jgi:hypothetical protein
MPITYRIDTDSISLTTSEERCVMWRSGPEAPLAQLGWRKRSYRRGLTTNLLSKVVGRATKRENRDGLYGRVDLEAQLFRNFSGASPYAESTTSVASNGTWVAAFDTPQLC